MDLKARYVTTEELMHALSIKLNVSMGSYCLTRPPWWDRSCDLGKLSILLLLQYLLFVSDD